MMATYLLPGIGGQVSSDENTPYQSSPLLNTYSARLFGSPPQLTHLNDMRLMSAEVGGDRPGPVGDFYLTRILQNAQIANFVVGRALFTGGMSSIANVIRIVGQYAYAMSKFDILESDGAKTANQNTANAVMQEANLETYQNALLNDTGWTDTAVAGTLSNISSDIDQDATVADLSAAEGLINKFTSWIEDIGDAATAGLGGLTSAVLTSLSVQQPFYTFESDWYSYINNVKMMINTAVIMLGLQNACVKIGDEFLPIGMNVNVDRDTDVWSNYRFITPNKGLGTVTSFDTQTGDTSQYVSFMIDPTSVSEQFTNRIGQSQIYSSVLSQGNPIGNEIAFLTNSSANSIDDAVLNIAGGAIGAAEQVLQALTGGVGRFTASLAGGFARSFIGDHSIYPNIFQEHESTSSMEITVKLNASAGDPYSYLTEILVPYFFILGMVLPNMSNNNASAYSFPPIIQCSIPGLWGTRLGMVESVSVTKNPNGNEVSVNGYPLSMNVTIRIADLQHVIMTSGMNKISTFLNNHTMFDYIAQMSGVDKYRVNGSVRLVARMALAASAVKNTFYNLGGAIMNDFTTLANRMTGTYRI